MLAPLLRTVSAILWIPLLLSAVLLAVGDMLRGRRRALPVLRRRRGAPDTDPLRSAARPAAAHAGRATPDPAPMVAALGRALDADPENRGRSRYLAQLERKLRLHGLNVLERAPVPGLKRALVELEGMVRNWSDPALAELRSRLAVAVHERGSASLVWKASATVAPLARAARNALARASAFRASRAIDLDAVTR